MLKDLTIHKAIQFAVAIEATGARIYTDLAKKYDQQQEISEAFSLLASDERAHGAKFKALLNEIPEDDKGSAGGDDYQYLAAMARSEFFSEEEGLTLKLEDIHSVQEALVKVLEFEKATLGFYLAIQDVVGPNDALSAILDEEKKHVARLAKYILTDEKMKGLSDEI